VRTINARSNLKPKEFLKLYSLEMPRKRGKEKEVDAGHRKAGFTCTSFWHATEAILPSEKKKPLEN